MDSNDPRILDAAMQLLRAPPGDRFEMLLRVPYEARDPVRAKLDDILMQMEERAAIREYDGEMSRSEAEAATRRDYGL